MPSSSRRIAAFYDVDGTLVDSNIVYAYLYYALRLPKISDRLKRISRAALLSPVYIAAELFNRSAFNRLFYANYKGLPFERLRLMGREVAEKAFIPHLYADARSRIRTAKEQGIVQVIVSGALDLVMEPFAAELGIDHVIANRLEFQDNVATGRLLPPVLAGEEKRKAVQTFARENDIDLSLSYAFGDSKADLGMLESVGFPCVVNPGKNLESIAAERGWTALAFS